MKDSVLNSEPDEDKDNAAIAETEGVGLQSMLDGRGTQNNKGIINQTGPVTGHGNASIYHVTIRNVRNYYSHPQPLLPSHDQSKEYSNSSAPKLLKYDKLDSANTNGILLSKSSPSKLSSSSLSTPCTRRAVLCGVNCEEGNFWLNGTFNDVYRMKELLVKNFKFPRECICVLTDAKKYPTLLPTRRNILESLKWLVKDCQPGDALVFYYSRGHGLRQPDFNGDEIDSFDGYLCPMDYMKKGMITGDDINSIIVGPLKEGVTLHAIIDAAYRGPILDLMFVYKLEDRKWNRKDNKPPTSRKHTSGGLVICLSGNEDSNMIAAKSKFTFLLERTIRESPAITYGSLLDMLHSQIEKVPLLSSSQEFDVQKKIFTM